MGCGVVVTCAILLWSPGLQSSCRAASTDGLRAFGILGKRSALASGTGILGFATELIATPITLVAELLPTQ